MKLVIVESPTKAKKLTGYLGSEYTVRASVGHVRDLPKSSMGIDTKHDFEPVYEVNPDKLQVVNDLKKLAKTASVVYLATDPDREGEAIAWHIRYLLHEGKKSESLTDHYLRATFHEITKNAVMKAIEHPTKLNMNLIDAQQARRVVDRLVGYSLSPVLWKKIRRGLSAGRVQSAALRLIAEREREIEAFKPDEYWEVDVLLNTDIKDKKSAEAIKKYKVKNAKDVEEFTTELPKELFVARVMQIGKKKYEPTSENDVKDVVSDLKTADYVVQSIEKKERRRASLPPFSTSLLQQAAANRLGFSGKQTMALAQQLYEEGLITYHRTDSLNLSTESIGMARGFIQQQYGEAYLPAQPRIFANKSKNAQEAHEAIRVTDVMVKGDAIKDVSRRFTDSHVRLYDLIWRRFLASQMKEAIYDSTTVLVEAKKGSNSYTLKTTGSTLKFDGWMKLFPNKGDILLPVLEEKQDLGYVDLNAAQKFTQPPPRFNDASLIKTLEEKGIGRPSTYASIISVIVERGYVERKEKRFFATPVGMTVNDFLVKHFPQIVDFDFTAEMEEDLDRIARGEKEWKGIIKQFFRPFEKIIASVTDSAEREQIPVEETGEMCPECGTTEKGKVVIRAGRFGKFRSCSRFPDCKYTEAIVEKLEGVKCPVCQEGDIIVKNTRWGKPFFGCGRYPDCDWASWGKPEPGLKISKAQWEVMKKERQERSEKRRATMEKRGTGRYAKSLKERSPSGRKATPKKLSAVKSRPAKKASKPKQSKSKKKTVPKKS